VNCVATEAKLRFSVRGFGYAPFLILGGKKMKKLFYAILLLMTVTLIFTSCGTNYESLYSQYLQNGGKLNYDDWYNMVLNISDEEEKGSEGLEYHLKSDGTYSVAWGSTNLLDKIVIPKMHNGKLVTEIEARGIISPWNAKEVVIPDSITTISQNAFASFYYLTSFVVPKHITKIEAGAFKSCVSLKSITIPDTVKSIDDSTFRFCISLEEIVLPNSIEEIGPSAFEKCYQLTSITIPKSVVSIDKTAFSSCKRLVEIINYSDLSFDNYFNKRIVHQGESLIRNVDGFKFITIDNINYLISYIGSDEKITLPEYYNGSEYELLPYYSLAYLTNFGYPSSINVKEIAIPKTIKTIPSCTFYENREFSDLYYLGTKNEWNNIEFGKSWLRNDFATTEVKIHCTDGDIK
jgi:hypothetical protein